MCSQRALQADGKIVITGHADVGGTQSIVARFNADGTLDTTFDSDGYATVNFGTSSETFNDVQIQSDGKIVVTGYAIIDGHEQITVARFETNGSLDTTFDTDGLVIIDIGGVDDRGNALAIQSDGSLVIVGETYNSTDDDIAVVRLNSNGSLDTSFDADGIRIISINGGYEDGCDVALDDNEQIVIVAKTSTNSGDSMVIRLNNSDGSYDTSFNGTGYASIEMGSPYEGIGELAIQNDGKIIVVGDAYVGGNNDAFIFRLNSDGTLDTSFSGDGKIINDISSGGIDSVQAVSVKDNGDIIIVGNTNGNQFIASYNNDGSVNTNFSAVTTLDGTPSYTEGGAAMVLDANVQIFDEELSAADNFSGAVLTLTRNGGADAEDVFSATGTLGALTESGSLVVGATTIGTVTTNSAGTLVLTFNANASNTLVNSAMQQIAYGNSSDTPPASVQIDWTFDDGNAGTQGSGGALQALGSTIVDITAVDDAPVARPDGVHLSFDGDDFVEVADNASLQMTNKVTMEAWINSTGTGTGSQVIINKEGEYELGITADTGEIKFAIAKSDNTWAWHDTGYFVTADEWTHVAVTYDGIAGEAKTYIDGVLVNTFSQSGVIGDVYAGLNNLWIGGRENDPLDRFEGQIDEVRVWNTTRTLGEIQANKDGQLGGAEAGLVGNWRLDEAAGGAVIDQSSFGNDGVLGGSEGAAATPSYQGYVTDQNTVLNIAAGAGVLANDYDVDSGGLTVTNLDTTGMLGNLVLNTADGSFSYDPNGAFDDLAVGEQATETFSYTANDGSLDSNTVTATITITGVNDAPVSVMMAISGVAFTFFFAINNKRNSAGAEKASEQLITQNSYTQQCLENMHGILDAEDEYMVQNGRFADNIDELHQLDSALDLVCPESGLPYSIVGTKESVQVICSVHGEV